MPVSPDFLHQLAAASETVLAVFISLSSTARQLILNFVLAVPLVSFVKRFSVVTFSQLSPLFCFKLRSLSSFSSYLSLVESIAPICIFESKYLNHKECHASGRLTIDLSVVVLSAY